MEAVIATLVDGAVDVLPLVGLCVAYLGYRVLTASFRRRNAGRGGGI